MTLNPEDVAARCCIYDVALTSGRLPSIAECVQTLGRTRDEIAISLQRLSDAHQLVLGSSGEILMAMPFSAVPTPFVVSSSGLQTHANCGWDALGVAAMLHRDAVIATSCADCGDALEIAITKSDVSGNALLHFAFPVRRWWESVVFT